MAYGQVVVLYPADGIHNWTTSVVPDLRQRTWPPSRHSLLNELCGYDQYVASGIAPAIFDRIGLRLSLYFPYSIGIEWFDAPDFKRAQERAVLSRFLLKRLREHQRKGILAARECINPDIGLQRMRLDGWGAHFMR